MQLPFKSDRIKAKALIKN